ncbi:MAG TPA: ABC transporter permease, partial [Chryseolinea sp.]
MLKHYWSTAIRNLARNKLFTCINSIGLSLSIAIFLALSGYVAYQLSFDKFYEGGDRIFRINYFEYQEGQAVLESARTHDRTALLVHEYVAQIEAVTRVYNEKAYVFNEDVRIVDQDMLFVDSSFFKVFPVKLVSGSKDNSLTPPKSVMISRSQSKVYFGDSDPIGQTLLFNERLPFMVTGVFEDIPANSSLDFDFLLSWSTIPFYGWGSKDGDFTNASVFTFVRVKEHVTDIEAINDRLTAMANEHITTLKKRGHKARQELRAYEDLHLAPSLSGEIKPTVNRTLLFTLVSLAIFILVAAWINYINLSLARSLERAAEIGVRKVFGASRMIISGQFLLEAFMLAVVTFVAGMILYVLFSGPLSHLLFENVQFASPGILQWSTYFVAFVVITTLIAFYPAYFISNYKPSLILKNKLGAGKGRANFLHQALMVFQLFLAVAIVAVTLIAGRQVEFMRGFDTGFNAKHTITLRGPASTNSDSLRKTRFITFRDEVLQHPAFISGASTMNVPGEEIRYHDEGVHAIGGNSEKKQSFWIMWVDEGYQDTFGMSLLEGRNFRASDSRGTCIINESAARALGYENPRDAVNNTLITGQQKSLTIIGLWKDYHHQSVRKTVDPIIFTPTHPHEYGYYSFRVQPNATNYLPLLHQIWKKHYPNDAFTHHFMDRFFELQYMADLLFERLLSLFSVISMTVACLGLFGMATLSMVKRTKEIGVRKVLGASVWNIIAMLSQSYIRLIMVSCAFAFPIAYYFTYQWLQGFAYKIEIAWWMIVLPGLIVLGATLLTITSQSLRAAMT